jgi:hypothetical protein
MFENPCPSALTLADRGPVYGMRPLRSAAPQDRPRLRKGGGVPGRAVSTAPPPNRVAYGSKLHRAPAGHRFAQHGLSEFDTPGMIVFSDRHTLYGQQSRSVVAINFIPNDPDVKHLPMSSIAPAPNRPTGTTTFAVANLPAQQLYDSDTTNFVAWQAREAALRALSVFEDICGKIPGWTGQPKKRTLNLLPNAGNDLNAYYDRRSVQFYEAAVDGQIFHSGASTDVVSHEVGHAILDAIRPDLWNVHMMEVAAFHEGFGDCIAIMTALSDAQTRLRILALDPTLRKGNFVETMAEGLSRAIGTAISPNHNAAKPRRALNKFKWRFPELLPDNGKPGVLINEEHSLGQLVSGCYYDLIVELFDSGGTRNEAGLWAACATTTRLFAEAVAKAPSGPRFLQIVGRTMLLVDQTLFQGVNGPSIRKVYQGHGIDVGGTTTFLSPKTFLSKERPKLKGKSFAGVLPEAARYNLRAVLDLPSDATVSVRALVLGGHEVAAAIASRPIDLTGISERLADCKAYTPQTAFIGAVKGGAAVLGAVDSTTMLANEVRGYVRTLVRNDAIDFDAQAKGAAAAAAKVGGRPTYHVLRRGDESVLERIGFSCGCRIKSRLCSNA